MEIIEKQDQETLHLLLEHQNRLVEEMKEIEYLIEKRKADIAQRFKESGVRIYATPWVNGVSYKINLVTRRNYSLDKLEVIKAIAQRPDKDDFYLLDTKKAIEVYKGTPLVLESETEYVTIKKEKQKE